MYDLSDKSVSRKISPVPKASQPVKPTHIMIHEKVRSQKGLILKCTGISEFEVSSSLTQRTEDGLQHSESRCSTDVPETETPTEKTTTTKVKDLGATTNRTNNHKSRESTTYC